MNHPDFDDQLWFLMGEHCEGKHYILGNPHTFPGRFLAWCPCKQVSFFASLAGVENCSVESRYWFQGLLHGSEPSPPRNSEGDIDFDSLEYAEWLKRCEDFRATGYWDDNV